MRKSIPSEEIDEKTDFFKKMVALRLDIDLIYEIVDYVKYKCDRFEEKINTRVWE